jgi:hypothetical protein
MDVVWNAGLLAALAATVGLLATALFRLEGLSRVELRLEQHLQTPH